MSKRKIEISNVRQTKQQKSNDFLCDSVDFNALLIEYSKLNFFVIKEDTLEIFKCDLEYIFEYLYDILEITTYFTINEIADMYVYNKFDPDKVIDNFELDDYLNEDEID